MRQGASDPEKVFDRTANLENTQIINYRVDAAEKWCVLIGIAPGAVERCVPSFNTKPKPYRLWWLAPALHQGGCVQASHQAAKISCLAAYQVPLGGWGSGVHTFSRVEPSVLRMVG